MADFPRHQGAKPSILSTFDPFCSATGEMCLTTGQNAALAGVWNAVNRAFYVPIDLEEPMVATRLACQVGTTAAGNLDMGLYTEVGNRIISTGSVAIGLAGLQSIDIADTLLPPGTYWLAMACSTITTATFRRSTTAGPVLRACGAQMQDAAIPLPAIATFATMTASFLPLITATGLPAVI